MVKGLHFRWLDTYPGPRSLYHVHMPRVGCLEARNWLASAHPLMRATEHIVCLGPCLIVDPIAKCDTLQMQIDAAGTAGLVEVQGTAGPHKRAVATAPSWSCIFGEEFTRRRYKEERAEVMGARRPSGLFISLPPLCVILQPTLLHNCYVVRKYHRPRRWVHNPPDRTWDVDVEAQGGRECCKWRFSSDRQK